VSIGLRVYVVVVFVSSGMLYCIIWMLSVSVGCGV